MTNANALAAKLLKSVVNWVYDANEKTKHWEEVRGEAKEAAAPAATEMGDGEESRLQRRLGEYRAEAYSHMADVGLTATREIQRAALDELGRLQQAFFVEDIDVGEPDEKQQVTAKVMLKPGRTIPSGYRFWWRAGGAPINGDGNQNLEVTIDATKLPSGETDVEAILGKSGSDAPLEHYV